MNLLVHPLDVACLRCLFFWAACLRSVSAVSIVLPTMRSALATMAAYKIAKTAMPYAVKHVLH